MVFNDGSNLIFIGGMPRSGTTWLANLFGSLPSAISGRELHLFDNYISKMVFAYYHEANYGAPDGISPLMSSQHFLQEFIRPLSDGLLNIYASSAALEKNIDLVEEAMKIVEKTPSNALHWSLIKELYPKSQMVFIVRDPRAVVASYKAAAQQPWGAWARRSVEDISISWLKYHAAVRSAVDNGVGRVIKYEDLINNPKKHLEDLFLELGIKVDCVVLERIIKQNSISSLSEAKSDNWRYDNRPLFFRKGKADSWREELTSAEIAQIGYLCGAAAEYEY